MLIDIDEKEEPATVTSGFGRLSELLDKAARADVLARELDELRFEFNRVQRQCDTLKKTVETVENERDQALESIQGIKDEVEKWKTKAAGLRETVEQLLRVPIEYYEVKDGDTLAGIAANPLVYGDPKRAIWLRQANEGKIKYLDNLRPGEVLVVPRFPRDGVYEF